MSDKWQIIRGDGSMLGPLTALEIRDALRMGHIDPFDRVFRVGSKLRQPLVEVDEIFANAESEAKQKVDSVYDKVEVANSLPAPVLQRPQMVAGDSTVVSDAVAAYGTASVEKPKRTIKSNDDDAGRRGGSPDRPKSFQKRQAKRYFLVDSKLRYHGPLSANEIQALFYRGSVEPGATVARDRTGPRIPVQQFVVAYSGNQARAYASEQTRFSQPATSNGMPSTKVMEQRARAIVAMQIQRAVLHHKFVAWAAIAICALLILGVMAYRLSTSEPHPKKSNSDTLNSDSKPDSDTLKYQKNTEMIDKKSVESLAPALPSKAEAGPTKLKEDAAKTSAKQARELAQRKRNAKAAKRRAEARDRIAKAKQSSTRFVPAPSQNRFVQSRQPAQQTSSGTREGSIVTLSGRFDPNALQRCGLKCTLRFKDQSGKSYSLVFFKAQYQSILSQKRGRAVVSGRLGAPAAVTVLYLQSVR